MPLAIVVSLVVLVLAEIAMRVAAPHLPDVLEWRDWQAQNKVEAMDALAKRGGASVVFLGTSQMNAALDPAMLTRLLRTDRPVFNAALNGSTARTMEPWMLDSVLPRLRPDVVVIGLNVGELNDANQVGDNSYSRFVDAIGYVRDSGHGTLLQRIEARLGSWSRLVRERTLLRKPSNLRHQDPAKLRATVNAFGEPRAIHIYDRVDYFVDPTWVRHIRELVLQGFHVGGRELSALSRLVGALRARGIEVVLLRMPMTKDALGLHPDGGAGFAEVGALLDSFADRHGAAWLDFMPRFPSSDDFFDPGHLKEQGRNRFTTLLADELRALHVLDAA